MTVGEARSAVDTTSTCDYASFAFPSSLAHSLVFQQRDVWVRGRRRIETVKFNGNFSRFRLFCALWSCKTFITPMLFSHITYICETQKIKIHKTRFSQFSRAIASAAAVESSVMRTMASYQTRDSKSNPIELNFNRTQSNSIELNRTQSVD